MLNMTTVCHFLQNYVRFLISLVFLNGAATGKLLRYAEIELDCAKPSVERAHYVPITTSYVCKTIYVRKRRNLFVVQREILCYNTH